MLALLPLTALAHEALVQPIPRYDTDGFSANKACPCGVGTNDQLCSDPTADSDPNRSTDRINTYTAGQTITVEVHEVVGHAGRWRIAFDPDGADLADFDANILLDVPDPSGNVGNTGYGDLWRWDVTLPDTPCDACTLQVIQVMDGDTVDPVPDPTGHASYFQCADLELLPSSPTTTGTGDTAVPTTDPTCTTDTTDPTGGTDTTPGTTATTGDSGQPDAGDEPSRDGCGCAGAPGPRDLLRPLVLVGLRRRKPGDPSRST